MHLPLCCVLVITVSTLPAITTASSKFTVVRRYCGRSLVSGILQACGVITRRELQEGAERLQGAGLTGDGAEQDMTHEDRIKRASRADWNGQNDLNGKSINKLNN